MANATRCCADCGADISHRTRTTQRCESCRDQRRRASRGINGLLQPRICEGCGKTYQPTGGLQRFCRSCVWDSASLWRMNHHGDDLERYRRDLASGKRTSTCETCSESFTYPYIGGADRSHCDLHLVVTGPAAPVRPKCTTCGLSSSALDEQGECHRHRERGARVERQCSGCEAVFTVIMSSSRRYCTSLCGNRNRKPMDKARSCVLCETAFAPIHQQQKYCKGCAGNKGLLHRASRYGISGVELKALKDRHGGKCWICRERPGKCVDHDHATGATRGWLCGTCNAALAYVERPDWWGDAVAYLVLTGSRVPGDDDSAIPMGGRGSTVRASAAA